jgi:flavorubredoxin
METRVAEVGAGIYQLSTHVAEIDFSFNQYLVTGDEPLLFHTGPRQMFPLIKDAVAKIIPPETLAWISFGHVESDECGSMNEWLAIAPGSRVGASALACMVSLNDKCDREPIPFTSGGEGYDAGGHVYQWIDTPHVPHGWEAGVMYDATTKTLFCGDLFTHLSTYAPTSDADIVSRAIEAEDVYHYSTLAPNSADIIRGLADLDVAQLALMHGPMFTGDCRAALLALADNYAARLKLSA